MNSLENEYSFLAPTWKLPSLTTLSIYPTTYGTSESTPPPPKLAVEMSTWNHNNNNNMQNSRYIPPNANRRTYPQPTHQQQGGGGGYPPQSYQHANEHYRNNENDNEELDMPPITRHNNYSDHRPANYPPPPPPQPAQKRVQIIDHNRHTPSTDHMSGRDSQDSYHTSDHNGNQPNSKARRFYVEDNKSDSAHSSLPRPNNFKIHEYLYGLSAPDPGSYVNAYRNHQRRLQDERMDHKSMMNEYKTFVKNGGFGPAFNSQNYQTYQERLESEKKRKSYSKIVREVNQYKVEEHKRVQNNGGQQRNRTYAALPVPRQRRPDELRSHFLSAKESYEYADCLENFPYSTPRLQLGIPFPISISERRTNSPLLRRASFDNLHPWNQTDVLTGELYADQSNRSSPVISLSPTAHRVRFHSRDFIRRRSSTFADLLTSLRDTNLSHRIGCSPSLFTTRKSAAKLLEEKDYLIPTNFNSLDDPTDLRCSSSSSSKRKEKKFITPHSMQKSDMQSSPAARLKTVNQPSKSENTIMATTSTALPKKPILIIRSPENSSKLIARTVRFEPEIIVNTVDDDDDDDQMTRRKLPSSATKNLKTKDPISNKDSTDD